MTFSKLECKEILRNLDTSECDDEVVAKLVEGSKNNASGLPRRSIAARHDADTVAVLDDVLERTIPHVRGVDLVLSPKMEQQGWTQEDVDRVNEERRRAIEMQSRLRPGVAATDDNPAPDARYAAFAAPETPLVPKDLVQIGDKNRYGDKCVRLLADGTPAFVCKNEHGYTMGVTPGCPRCFMDGDRGVARNAARIDPDSIPGEDSAW